MKPLKHKHIKVFPPLIGVDTEDDSEGNVKSWSFYHYKDGKRYTTYNNEEARKYINLQPKSIFVAHNLEYDLVNLYRDSGFREIKEMQYTARLVSAQLKHRSHRFIDSFNFFPENLAKMGETIGLEKLPFDPDSLEYAERDPEIVAKFMGNFRQKLKDTFGIELTNTVGSLSMKIFLERYLKDEYTPFNDQIALDAFYGGRCEVFYRGEVKENIWEADINSEYPTVMTYEFPNTNTMRKLNGVNCRFGVADCTVSTPKKLYVPLLPLKIDGKLCFPLGTFRGTWTFAEIRKAKKLGYKVLKIHSAYGTDDGCYPFKEYMEDCYDRRTESKTDEDKGFWKALMVNLYGRLMMHNSRCVLTEGLMDPWEEEETNAILKAVYGNIYVYEIPMLDPPNSCNYLWGAYVTSYGRILLYEQLEKAYWNKGTTLLYCDTDSVICKGEKPPLDYDEKRLGALKAETWEYGNFVMPKGYWLVRHDKKKVTCKGIPQPYDIKEKGLELSVENPRMAFLTLGRAEFKKPIKLRQSLVMKKKANVWEKQIKVKKTVATKRIETGSGPTFPLVVMV
jgi:hypothetical protein